MTVTQIKEVNNQGSSKDFRYDWTAEEVLAIHDLPLMDLLYKAQTMHRTYHEDNTVQLASLLSIKTGACPEDCKYCPQSAHYAKKQV